jgi:hypothetical protein
MAVDDHLQVVVPLSITSTSSSPSSSPVTGRRRFIQVATDNSSTFIQFPINSRQSSLFVPTYRPGTRLSTARPFSRAKDTQSRSNRSKSSNTPSASTVSAGHKRNHSQEKSNPILNNSLLNHRKEQPKSFPIKISTDSSHTTRLSLSSKPLKTISNDNQISTIPASTAPLSVHQTENSISDQQIIPDDNENNDEQKIHCLDKSKYDYITQWLHAVRQATYSTKTFLKKKSSKNRFIQS